MSLKKLGIAVTLAAAAGGIALGGAAIADAATNTPTPSASSTTDGGGSSDTAVTGDEADKVIAAVKAKDSAASITSVRKDPDGTYDAIGTKSGNPVMYDVSTDLKTITENSHGGGGHGGGHDGSADTAVTGDQADKVIAAVKTKDSTVTITSVRKDPDGTYDAIGTKSGNPVMYDVSTDLKTITQNTHSGSGHGPGSPNSSTPSATPSA